MSTALQRTFIASLDLRCQTLTNAAYHANTTHLGSSSLKALDREGPEYAAAYHSGLLRSDSEALSVGSAIHAILDGTYRDEYSIAPTERGYSSRVTKAFQQMRDDMRRGGDSRTLLTSDEATEAEKCAEALQRVFASKYVGHRTWREPSLFWEEQTEHGALPCKCRPDRLVDDGRRGAHYHEIKSAARIGPADARAAFWRYGYWLQQAHYEAGIIACGAAMVETRFVFVRKAPPHDVAVYVMSPQDRENAAWRWRKLVEEWSRRSATNDWGNGTLANPTTLTLGIRGDETQLEGFDDE